MKLTTLKIKLSLPGKYLYASVFVILLVASFFKELNSLRVVALRVPTKVKVGGRADLACLYDLEFDKALLTLKWFFTPKGNTDPTKEIEFYRYTAKEDPEEMGTKEAFPVDGFMVNQANFGKSSPGKISLMNITMQAAGTYTCKVEAKETGATDKDDNNMNVYEVAANTSASFYLHISLLFVTFFALFWNHS